MKTKTISLLLFLGIVLSVFVFASCDKRVISTTERNETTSTTSVDTTDETIAPSETTASETEPPAETTASEPEPPAQSTDDEYTKNY